MPLARSSSSVSWRCEVDGGWTTIVWTPPRDAVRSAELQGVDDRLAGGPPAGDLEGEHPAAVAGAPLALDDRVLRMGRQARVQDALHARLTLEPLGECQRVLAVPVHPHREGEDPADGQEGLERRERRAGIHLDAGHARPRARPARRRPRP